MPSCGWFIGFPHSPALGDFFDPDKYPHLTFKSTEIRRTSDGYEVTGDLTIRDTTKRVTLEVEGGDQVGSVGRYAHRVLGEDVDQPQGFRPQLERRARGRRFLVGDKIEITLEIEAVEKAASVAA